MKVEYRNGLHNYLATELASIGDTVLHTTPWRKSPWDARKKSPWGTPWESKDSLPLRFVDIFASIVWAHHEHGTGSAYQIAAPYLDERRLFFNNPTHERVVELC